MLTPPFHATLPFIDSNQPWMIPTFIFDKTDYFFTDASKSIEHFFNGTEHAGHVELYNLNAIFASVLESDLLSCKTDD